MQKILEEYHLGTFLEALTFPPKTYQNLILVQSINTLPIQGVFEVLIHSCKKTPKTLKISATLSAFNQPLNITIFHPKRFHTTLFPPHSTLYIHGTLERKMGLEIIQPKVVKEFGEIVPIFEQKEKAMMQKIRPFITQKTLEQFLLPKEFISPLLEIFHPTLEFFSQFMRYKGFPPAHLRALKFIEIFCYMQGLSKKKTHFPAKVQCRGELKDFLSSLPFSLTKGQNNALEEIRQDFASGIASKRLIMGDVGSGKTLVILGAVVMAYPHKSILMAPTTILATQLYEEALKFLPPYIKVGLFLGNSKSKKQSYEEFDFIIGTQALIHREEDLKDFALVMSDEQHRFGTQQRFFLEKLASSEGKKPHILQFSATPIPRTMAMLQADLISHTFIKDTPFKKNITTSILHKQDFSSLLTHIKNEIALNHQVIIVYPLVEESENFAYTSLKEGEGYWRKHFEKVYCTNGADKDKEKILQEFREEGNILLATTLIEVGISLPKLSTIIIVGAERMGLATLHQLRGRVSRNGLKGYCFLFTYSHNNQRLKDFAKTTNGFEIAELDLKYRKSGDLLDGERQSGNEFKFFVQSEDEEIVKISKEVLELSKNPKKQDIINDLQ